MFSKNKMTKIRRKRRVENVQVFRVPKEERNTFPRMRMNP